MSGILDGKVALVTGASNGIGEGVVRLFCKEGAKVVFIARRAEKSQGIVDEIRAAGGEVTFVCGDAGNKEDLDRLYQTAVDTYGTVDILIGHAGIGAGFKPHEANLETDFEPVVNLNLRTNFYLASKVLPGMMEKKGGSIVFTSSNAGTGCGSPGASTYALTKAGLDNFVMSLCMEYGQYNIRANTVRPGVITTALSPAGGYMERLQTPYIPMHRPGTVEEIAQLYLFLASDLCPYINGQNILCDGGVNCGILFPPLNDPDEDFGEGCRP